MRYQETGMHTGGSTPPRLHQNFTCIGRRMQIFGLLLIVVSFALFLIGLMVVLVWALGDEMAEARAARRRGKFTKWID